MCSYHLKNHIKWCRRPDRILHPIVLNSIASTLPSSIADETPSASPYSANLALQDVRSDHQGTRRSVLQY